MCLAAGERLKNKYPVLFSDGITDPCAIRYHALVNADIHVPAHTPAFIEDVIEKAGREQIDLIQHLTHGIA